jgi:hypothetical protein
LPYNKDKRKDKQDGVAGGDCSKSAEGGEVVVARFSYRQSIHFRQLQPHRLGFM